MSNHSSQEVTEKKKKDVWQEAGGEFYQESYPSGSGQNERGNNRKSSRHNIPLPSQTARRNSYAYSRRRNTNTSYGRTGTVNAYTYTSTGIGTATVTHEVHVSVLPDLADMTIPNERKRWDELRKIKAMPISMAAKRELKAQLTTIPMLKLKGWKRLRWHQQRFIEAFENSWAKRSRNLGFMKRSLMNIDSRCGTSIVKVFQFMKWTAFLNFWIFLTIATFLIFPGILGVESEIRDVNGTCPLDFNSSVHYNTSSSWHSESAEKNKQLADCCSESYYVNTGRIRERDSYGRALIGLVLESRAMAIEYSPFVYGFYPSQEISLAQVNYSYAKVYALLPVLAFALCLVLLVPQIATGIKELISAREGEFYSYSNLIFSGWDHYTKDETGAKFKKKILKHEMKVALKTEKRKIEASLRTRKQKWQLWIVRIITNLMVVAIQVVAGATICFVTQLAIDETLKCEDCDVVSVSALSATKEVDFRRIGFQLLPATCISLVNMAFPVILQQIGKLEKYSPSTQMKWLLIRSLLVRLLSLAFAGYQLFSAVYCSKLEGTCTFCNDANLQGKGVVEKSPCWESVIGEHLYALLIVDFSIKAIMVFVIGFGRWLLGRYIPLKVCTRMGRMKFCIVDCSLDIVYAQFLAWFFYFAPFIPIVVTIYCLLMFYMMKFSVLVNCRAVPNTFKTTRTTTVLIVAKLISFTVASVAIGIVLSSLQPSRSCGPFRQFNSPWETVTELYSRENTRIHGILALLGSPVVTIPVAVILFLVGFYYYSVAKANRGMVETLRHLLILESKDKQYLWTAVCERDTRTNNTTTIDL